MQDKKFVTKSNKLIEAQYKLSLAEQRLILMACVKLKEDENKKVVSFFMSEMEDIFNSNINYDYYVDLCRGLMRKQIHLIKQIDDEKTNNLEVNWISSIEYNAGWIEIEFSEKLLPYLIKLSNNYTEYEIQNISRMKSIYSVRLYELLKQYQDVGFRRFKISELRDILQTGDSFKEYRYLKNNLIDKSLKDINDNTDLFIEYSATRKGRSYDTAIFKISKKSHKEIKDAGLDISNDISYIMNFIINIDEYSLSEMNVITLLRQGYSKENIIAKYFLLTNQRDVLNKIGWMTKALKEDYQLPDGEDRESIEASLLMYKQYREKSSIL